MPRQLGLPAALARFGLRVELAPGWETRGGATFNPRGAVSHWTAGPRNSTTRPSLNICINGRAGLPGPLCNVYLDRNGIAVVCASGTANHAGVGGWKGLTGNSQVFGTEAECGGDGDWTAAQRDAYPRVNAAYCALGGFGADMVCGHSEWAPTRKIDIRDWPMSAMRQQVAAILSGSTASTTEDDMFSDQDRKDLQYVKAFVDWWLVPDDNPATPANEAAPNSKGELAKRLRDVAGMVGALTARGHNAVDPAVVAASIKAALPADLARQVASELVDQLRAP